MDYIGAANYKLETPQSTMKGMYEWDNKWISPSQKVKSIAMKGRQGLESFKNIKLLAPAYPTSKL